MIVAVLILAVLLAISVFITVLANCRARVYRIEVLELTRILRLTANEIIAVSDKVQENE